ncbi:MAG: PduO protein [Nocardioides sp.]|nr:PduO protein [Nocardioides sp.]
MALSLAEAQQVLGAAQSAAEGLGVPMSIAILDGGRELLVFARQDGVALGTIEVAVSKAYTACSTGSDTAELRPLTQPGQPLFGLEGVHPRGYLTLPGGRVLRAGATRIVGAIGVSGGSPDEDDRVAAAGVAALCTS